MKKNNKSVSIGIPAYQEANNIAQLIQTLFKQKKNIYKLKEIIVVSDASTDGTEREVKKIKNKRIKLIINKKRIGQALSQEVIRKKFSGDILILLNGDIQIRNNNFIEKLLEPFYKYKKIGIVSAQIQPLDARNIFERVLNFSVNFKRYLYISWNKGNNLYSCYGRARAFSREFCEKFTWEKIVSEDAYSYLTCIQKGYRFIFCPQAIVYYRSPSKLGEHLNQSIRFLQSQKELSFHFKKKFIDKEYRIPFKKCFFAILKYFIKNPLFFIIFLAVFFVAKLVPQKKLIYKWDVATTSKFI